jgi:hypothetical protein
MNIFYENCVKFILNRISIVTQLKFFVKPKNFEEPLIDIYTLHLK